MNIQKMNEFLGEAVGSLVEFNYTPKKLTPLQKAQNAWRDMAYSKQYQGIVSDKDVKHMLSSKSWQKVYGKSNLTKAWKGLVKGGDVVLKDGKWEWIYMVDSFKRFGRSTAGD